MTYKIKIAEQTARHERVIALHRAGLAPKQIAYEIGRSINTVYRHFRRAGIRVRPLRGMTETYLREQIAAGRTICGIAREWQVSNQAIYQRIRREGWEVRR